MALEVLSSVGVFDEFQEIANLHREELSHFVRSGEEELSAQVHLIQPAARKGCVELILQG